MKRYAYQIILAIVLGLILGAAHIDSCNQEKANLILNIEHSYIAEEKEILKPEIISKPRIIQLVELEYQDPDIPDAVEEAAIRYGEQYDICPEFLEALAWRESRYHPDAVSSDGSCIGICQVNPRWHRDRMERLGKGDLYDIDCNMNVAADYLAELFEKHPGDPNIVLMRYNGDSTWKSGETSDYAEDILKKSAELEKKHGK